MMLVPNSKWIETLVRESRGMLVTLDKSGLSPHTTKFIESLIRHAKGTLTATEEWLKAKKSDAADEQQHN
jgi:hypothetical protein